jgi:hypothetical protein
MSTPSETLRAAAARIREVAQAATPGPWVSLDNGDRIIRDAEQPMQSYFVDGSRVTEEGPPEYVVDEPLHTNPANGEHIALWHPLVAEAAAELLDSVAQDMEDNDGAPGYGWDEATSLARLVLGEVAA